MCLYKPPGGARIGGKGQKDPWERKKTSLWSYILITNMGCQQLVTLLVCTFLINMFCNEASGILHLLVLQGVLFIRVWRIYIRKNLAIPSLLLQFLNLTLVNFYAKVSKSNTFLILISVLIIDQVLGTLFSTFLWHYIST